MKVIRKTPKKKNDVLLRSIPSILILLAFAFLVRIILSPFGTLTLDQNTFVAWSMRLVNVGIPKFYFGMWSDYLPGYLYVLNLLGQIGKLNVFPDVILYKLPGILSDIGTGYLIYRIVRKLKDETWGRIAAALYIFNPAVIANSALWGQVDGLTSLFSILTIWALPINLYMSAAALAVGTLIKPQMAIISLIILIMMIKNKVSIQKISAYIVTSFAIFVAGFIPFSNGTNLVEFISGRLNLSLNQYPYTSVNAFNFWGIIGSWKPDTTLNVIGIGIVVVLFFVVGVKFLNKKGGEYILLAFTYAAAFLFMTRMHERHLLPALAPLTVAVSLNPIFIFSLIGFSFVYLSNLYWAWNWITNNFAEIFPVFVVKILSTVNVLMLGFFLLPQKVLNVFEDSIPSFRDVFSKMDMPEGNINKVSRDVFQFEKPRINVQKIKILFIGVVIFAAITRFYGLNSPENHYFDEVYHAFTAQNMLHGVTKAWEWWNPNPTGFAYEWTHPPLAKELMAVSMKVLGENAFGWRFPGAILGVGSVILIYFIAKEIFKDELTGLIAAGALALDGLPLVLSRIGMNDSYMLFFSLATLYFYLKKKNLISAIFLGLALSSKWSALWVIPIVFVAHFILKRKFKLSYIFFVFIPPIIYISCYFPLFTNKEIQSEYVANTYYSTKTDKIGIIPLDMFIDTQKQMWWYHTRLKATHPYTSPWYTWPFMVRPVYVYTSDEVDGNVARIYATGNPVIFWGGTIAVGITLFFALKERNKKLGLVVFSYLVFFTPWALSPRIMFLYHYLPSIPFMAIAIAYILRRFKGYLIFFLILGAISFIYFYPHFAGLTIPVPLDTSYYWINSWR